MSRPSHPLCTMTSESTTWLLLRSDRSSCIREATENQGFKYTEGLNTLTVKHHRILSDDTIWGTLLSDIACDKCSSHRFSLIAKYIVPVVSIDHCIITLGPFQDVGDWLLAHRHILSRIQPALFPFIPQYKQTSELVRLGFLVNISQSTPPPQFMHPCDPCDLLEAIRPNLQTAEVVEVAIKISGGMSLRSVIPALVTDSLCRDAIRYSDGTALMFIERRWMTHELCSYALDFYKATLGMIPQELRSLHLCKQALQYSTDAFKYVPDTLKTYDLCLETVNRGINSSHVGMVMAQGGSALLWLPTTRNCRLTPEQISALRLAAVRHDGGALRFIKPVHRTEPLCRAAVMNASNAIHYVLVNSIHLSESIKHNLCELAIAFNSRAFRFITRPYQTPELCRTACDMDGANIKYIRNSALITSEICTLIIEQDPTLLGCVPKHLRSAELCMYACSQAGNMIQYVPKSVITEEMRLVAVHQNGMALGCISKEHQTYGICTAAIYQNPHALQYLKRPIDRSDWDLAFQSFEASAPVTPTPLSNHVTAKLIEHAITVGDMCPIMQKPIDAESAVVTSCGHVFSNEVIDGWIATHKTCPTCRQVCVVGT